jgi:hypothetical protein
MNDLLEGIAEALEAYRESRLIDAGSAEWASLLVWYRENRSDDTLVFAGALDWQLARMRDDNGNG